MSVWARVSRALALAACVGVAGSAFADRLSQASDQIRKRLQEQAQSHKVSIVGEIRIGQLVEPDDETFTFKVDPGKAYVAFGACDDSCSELSLAAREKGGAFIDNSSGQDNDHPLIAIEDFKGDEITIEATMFECDADPCVFGIALAETGAARSSRTADPIALLDLLFSDSSRGTTTTGNSNSVDNEPADAELSDEARAALVAALRKRVPEFFEQSDDILTGKLKSGEHKQWQYEVDPGGIHEIYAICDDCGNLDLFAYDEDGNKLGSDTDSDSKPALEITSDSWPRERRSGKQKLIIDVRMISCSKNACGYSVGTFKPK